MRAEAAGDQGRFSHIHIQFERQKLLRRLILKSFQSPGDVVMLTAAVRDLHVACPGQFQTDVRTSADALWENNPHITPLKENESGVESIDMHYPLIHQSNQRPYHFIHGYTQFLEDKLALRIPVTCFHGDIHLSRDEKNAAPPGRELGVPERYWIVIAGGKYDFTAKWWNPSSFQKVVDHCRNRIVFVQCGEAGHWHPPLDGVVNLLGKTTTREFVRLMHHAEGVLCPVSFAMHLAAAVEVPGGRAKYRPCVVIAGGREPAHWEQYPGHQFITNVGSLPCCARGACWRSRCQPVGDGDEKDRRNVCERPVQVTENLRIPQCMTMITPEEVIRRIELYDESGAVANGHTVCASPTTSVTASTEQPEHPALPQVAKSRNVLLEFRHGLGDAIQLTIVLKHLRQQRPDWNVDVAALWGKHSALTGFCRSAFVLDKDRLDRASYQDVFRLDWHEAHGGFTHVPTTKPARCLREVFGLEPKEELFCYEIQRSGQADRAAREYLAGVTGKPPADNGRYPVFLLHYEGNTSSDRKNLSHALASDLCQEAIRLGLTPVILDWDRRSPLPDNHRIFNPGADHPLWTGGGTGDAEVIAALMEAATLVVGVDSGPLHVAGAVTTQTIAVWTQHHPVHFFDLADNVLHLVPKNYSRHARSKEAQAYFEGHYRHHIYADLAVELPAAMASLLTDEPIESALGKDREAVLTAVSYDRSYYEEHKQAGLDYLGHGQWQQEYGQWLADALELRGKRILDVGCACGSILRGLAHAGMIVRGVDINEHMIALGREKWPDMAPLLSVCDGANLHLFVDQTFDAIHTAQVAEHWRPELVPVILRELARVTRAGGLMWLCLDTQETYDRQNRCPENEDPTHLCIRPTSWWQDILAETGWEVCSDEFNARLRSHSLSFLQRYDWDWLLARRI